MALIVTENDPLLLLAGRGEQIWAEEPADGYVRRLREGCDQEGQAAGWANQKQRAYRRLSNLHPMAGEGLV